VGKANDDADVLVIFGVTGDAAKVMTFHARYPLETRNPSNCPILAVAVDHRTTDDLPERAQDSTEATVRKLDHDVFDRLAARMSYLDRDFADTENCDKVVRAIQGMSEPVLCVKIPPAGSVRQLKGRPTRSGDGGVVVESPSAAVLRPLVNSPPNFKPPNFNLCVQKPRASSDRLLGWQARPRGCAPSLFHEDRPESGAHKVLRLHAALVGNALASADRDGVAEECRIVQSLLDNPPPAHSYQPGSWDRRQPFNPSPPTAAGANPGRGKS